MNLRALGLILTLALPAAPPATAGEEGAAETFGAGVTLGETTAIARILADPDAWKGKTVRVEGRITDVCQKKGCWMEIEGEGPGERLRVQVQDDVIVFPRDAAGARAAAQGTVEIQELTRDQYVGWMAHLAADKGEEFDEGSVGDGPYRLVQLAGTGAEIVR